MIRSLQANRKAEGQHPERLGLELRGYGQGPVWGGPGTEGLKAGGSEEGREFAVSPAGQASSESVLWGSAPTGVRGRRESVHRTALASECVAGTPVSCLCSRKKCLGKELPLAVQSS